MSHVANVVGMVVSVKKNRGAGSERLSSGPNSDNFGKLFFHFPEEKDCEAHYTGKMLMLDGYAIKHSMKHVVYLLLAEWHVADVAVHGSQLKWPGRNLLLPSVKSRTAF